MQRNSFILIFCICFLIPLGGCSKTSEYAKKEEVPPTVSISPTKNIKTKKSIYLESKYLNEYKSIEWVVNKKKKIKLEPSKFKLSKDAKFSMLYNNKSKQEIIKIQHKGYFISISNDVNTTYKSFYNLSKKEYKNIIQFNP